MKAQDFLDRLVAEYGYPPKGAELVAGKLVSLTSPVQEAFSTWWETGNEPDVEIQGYSVQRLLDEHHMKTIAAFLTLDWLNREPAAALASLSKGHDRVG